MKRRSFFATLAGVFVAPKVLESKPIEKSYFNTDVLKRRMDEIKEYRNPLESDGVLVIENGVISIVGAGMCSVRINDIVVTDVISEKLLCIYHRVNHHATNTRSHEYTLRPLSNKKICGRQVIMIRGKYRLLSTKEFCSIAFMPIASTFSEGGVLHG